MKACSKCFQHQNLSQYRGAKTGADGLRSDCRTCEKKRINKLRDRKAYKKQYIKNNPEKYAEWSAHRRAVTLLRTPGWLEDNHRTAIRQFYKDASYLSNYTQTTFHVDHIVPLQGKNVSGLHVPWNLQLLTEAENVIKSNKF